MSLQPMVAHPCRCSAEDGSSTSDSHEGFRVCSGSCRRMCMRTCPPQYRTYSTRSTQCPSHRFTQTPKEQLHPPSSPSASAFANPVTCFSMVKHCDWPTLMAVSRTSKHGREAARAVVHARRRASSPLRRAGYGRLLWDASLFEGRCCRVDRCIHDCEAWFVGRGYVRGPSAHVHTGYRTLVSSVHTLTKSTANDSLVRVTISSAITTYNRGAFRPTLSGTQERDRDHSLVQIALASPFTAQQNLLTSTRVYSAFPDLIGERTSLMATYQSRIRPDGREQDYSSFIPVKDNSAWSGHSADGRALTIRIHAGHVRLPCSLTGRIVVAKMGSSGELNGVHR